MRGSQRMGIPFWGVPRVRMIDDELYWVLYPPTPVFGFRSYQLMFKYDTHVKNMQQ